MDNQERPTASFFYDDVVRVIGELTDFVPEAEVLSSVVIDKVLFDRGLDRSSGGISESRKDGKSRLVLCIEWAFRNQRAEHRGENTKLRIPCQQGQKRGMWALTEAGVEKSKLLSQGFEEGEPVQEEPVQEKRKGKKGGSGSGSGSGPRKVSFVVTPDSVVETPLPEDTTLPVQATTLKENLTARYFEKNWNVVYPEICLFLRKKLRISAASDLVEDHAMHFITRCIAKDSLYKFLSQGRDPSLLNLVWFAYRSAISEMRPWGRDPVTRCLRGARTPLEVRTWKRRNVDKHSEYHTQERQIQMLVQQERSYLERPACVLAYGGDETPRWHQHWGYSADLEDQILEADLGQRFLDKIEEVLRDSAPLPERQERLQYLVQGLTDMGRASELAVELNVSRSTISNQVQFLKRTLQQAREQGVFAEYLS